MSGEFNTATIIAIIAVVVILFLAIRYIVREKKRGVKCIGCPMAGSCTKAYKDMEEDMRKCLERTRAE
ncbi:MAG: FeoB-associated Cys-rich membrane protein [Firmicutes bacterium]|nr:FeoB-associated Cys-rich membrane protein [Bacillota bacterium]